MLTCKTVHWLILLIQRIYLRAMIFCVDFFFFFVLNLKYFAEDFVSVQYPAKFLDPRSKLCHIGVQFL